MTGRSITVMLLLTGVLFASSARASYIESCQLKGRVVSKPVILRIYFMNEQGLEVEREETSFQFKVIKSMISGRADSGCKNFLGQTVDVVLNGGFAVVKQIKIKQILTLNYFAKDNENTSMRGFFTLPNLVEPFIAPKND